MARFLAHLVFALYLTSALGQVNFTGNAADDFDLTITPQDKRGITLKRIDNDNTLVGTPDMEALGRRSGFDLKSLFVQYDWVADELYGAFDCWAICGDADGDGNPSEWTDPKRGKYDDHLQQDTEWTAMGIQTNPAPEYTPTQDSWVGYYPDIGVGDSYAGGLDWVPATDKDAAIPPFGSWRVKSDEWCNGLSAEKCLETRGTGFVQFASRFEYPIPSTSRGPLAATYGLRPVQDVVLAHFPNSTWQDIEFRMKNFSQYGHFNFTPGIDSIKFAYHLSMGGLRDDSGEDFTYPQLLEIDCIIKDDCGTCNGNNSVCADCNGDPYGLREIDECGNCVLVVPEEYHYRDACKECVLIANFNQSVDACGVCHGQNKSCSDCSGTPHGTKVNDTCGVCGGLDKDIDACNICFGDNSTCADCAGVPNGDAVYDDCGVCDGFNLDKDACDICFGDNSTCSDCFGIPHGTAVYDECGICFGDNSTCADCHGVPNGGAVYDVCNVCGGLNNTCYDCAGQPAGLHFLDNCKRCVLVDNGEVLDICNVCGGKNDTCTDCAGKKWEDGENAHIDGCNNCILYGQPNTMVDDCGRCLGNNEDKDVCGVCFGLNDTCYGCDMVPASGLVYDNCGVCGGDNTTCDCYIWTNVTIGAADTWIDLRNRTQNHGRDVDLWVSSDKQRSLLRFDDIRFKINGATEQRPEILNATLKLFVRGEVVLGDYGMGFKESGKVAVHVLDNNFCEEKATWECRDYDSTGCCVQWRMLALYPKVKADYEFTETASVDLKEIEGHRGWITFDVTEDIKDFMNNGFLNSRSYLVKKDCETDWGWIKFWSCDTPGQMNCPNLEIHLKSRCFPVPVIPEPEPEVC